MSSWEGELLEQYRCPFLGIPLRLCPVGALWILVSEAPGVGWVSSPFPTRQAALKFLAGQPVLAVDEPASERNRVCPWFGTPIRVRQMSDYAWAAESDDGAGHGYSTVAFWSENHLDFFLSTRAGVPPLFGAGNVRVVGERAKPPPPDLAVEESKARLAEVRGHAQEVIDQVGLATGILVPKPIVGPATHTGKRR